MTETSEINTAHDSKTFTSWLRQITAGSLTRIAHGLARLNVRPTTLTFLGLGVAACAGIAASTGRFWLAGVIYLLGSPFDALDGMVARVDNRVTVVGGMLDSSLDRYGEAFLLTGIGYALAASGDFLGLLFVFAVMTGSFMVSYVRARAEGLGFNLKVGLLTRVERYIAMLVILFTGYITVGMGIMAVLVHLTVAQRLFYFSKVN